MTPSRLVELISTYALAIRRIRDDPDHQPETSLYPPLQTLLEALSDEFNKRGSVISQRSSSQRGVPDFTLLNPDRLPFAWVEAKDPRKAVGRREDFKGPDRAQFDRYAELPCVLYTNYWEAALFVEGEKVESVEILPQEDLDPDAAVKTRVADSSAVFRLFEHLFSFKPEPLRTPVQVAGALARRARLVREVVEEVIAGDEANPLREIYGEFEDVLFSELTPARFADAYAQTLTYGLLLARVSNPDVVLTLDSAPGLLGKNHKLLSSAVRLLGQPEPVALIGWSVEALLATVNVVAEESLTGTAVEESLLYFYEDFLAAYDPELRKKVGVYYTPLEVVTFQVRACEELLEGELGVTEGLASGDVRILDPATGTGTYQLGVARSVERRVRQESGKAAVKSALASLSKRMFGFELLVGPYAVARWRLGTLLRAAGVDAVPQTFLTDTLVEPTHGINVPGKFGFMSAALTSEREAADQVKSQTPIVVILGNPPYGRTKVLTQADSEDKAGKWQWAWDKVTDFKTGLPARERRNIKNLADLYVLFWRWALWKLLDEAEASGPRRGVLTFITNRSYLSGGVFQVMRAFMRREFDRIDLIDLGGDNRAGRLDDATADENVFEIETGVAICVCTRKNSCRTGASDVRYRRLRGTRAEKLAALAGVDLESGFERVEAGKDGQASFIPVADSDFHGWPALPSLFERNSSGVETGRDDLVVATRLDELRHRFRRLAKLGEDEAKALFHESRDRKLPTMAGFRFDTSAVRPYAYRPLDRRRVYLDDAFIGFSRRERLQDVWGTENVCLFTVPNKHGSGPVAFVHGALPDRHAFRGSYGGYAFPLWDASRAKGRRRATNLRRDLMEQLTKAYGDADPEEVFDYIYAILCAPSYAEQFHEELQQSFPRVPFPKEKELFDALQRFGQELVQAHTLDAAFRDDCRLDGEESKLERIAFDAEREVVKLGDDLELTAVTSAMWAFAVSGYPVLQRWLEARVGLELTTEEIRELRAVVHAVRVTVERGPSLDARFAELTAARHLELVLPERERE